MHLILSPILIFGWLGLPFPELAGVAVATLISRFMDAGINVFALAYGSSRLQLSIRHYRPDFPIVYWLLKMGLPASVTKMQRGVSHLIVLGIASHPLARVP